MPPLINAEPVVHARRVVRRERARPLDEDDETREPFDALEVFGHLREICDPEHPHTLEQARVSRSVPVVLHRCAWSERARVLWQRS